MKIRMGSRGSDLALWQTHFVREKLLQQGHEVTVHIIATKGDRIASLSFDKMEGKGFFTKEIETALLRREIDLAVHSHKDLETSSPEGLEIGAVSYREDPADALLIRPDAVDLSCALSVRENAVIGTSSARRQTQFRRSRPDVRIKALRGNVPTRIQQLRRGNYDGIVLAKASIKRLALALSDVKVVELDPTVFVPAPAQGVLALQIRSGDAEVRSALTVLHDPEVYERTKVEREVLKNMHGGCQLPLGVYCLRENDQFVVHTAYASSARGSAAIKTYRSGDTEQLIRTITDDLNN